MRSVLVICLLLSAMAMQPAAFAGFVNKARGVPGGPTFGRPKYSPTSPGGCGCDENCCGDDCC